VGSRPGAQLDQRLLAAATTYSSEGVGADGGFAVPQEFRTAIWQKVMGEDSLLSRCDQLVTGSNNMTVPADETTPWDTTGGVQVYWEGEAASVSASKAMFERSPCASTS
jgi:HK97 family phage major capsid protein